MIISLIEALLDSQLDTLYSNPLSYASNPFLMYLAVKSNQIFSIRQGSLKTLDDVITAYNNQVSMFTIIFYVLSAVMVFGVIIWFFTSIPYVLSVTKINNRVLSLVIYSINKYLVLTNSKSWCTQTYSKMLFVYEIEFIGGNCQWWGCCWDNWWWADGWESEWK